MPIPIRDPAGPFFAKKAPVNPIPDNIDAKLIPDFNI